MTKATDVRQDCASELAPLQIRRPTRGSIFGGVSISKKMPTIVEDYEESRDTRENKGSNQIIKKSTALLNKRTKIILPVSRLDFSAME